MAEHREQEELDKMIGKPNGWTLRWGMSLLLGLLLLLLLLGILISYPDRLEGSVQLYYGTAPVEVRSPSEAILENILVRTEEEVNAGQWLGVLHNAANSADIQQLSSMLAAVGTASEDWFRQDWDELVLGDVQAAYDHFRAQLLFITEWDAADQTASKRILLNQRVAELIDVEEALERQAELMIEETALADSSLMRQRELYERGAISLVELEMMERQVSQNRRLLEGIRIRQAENRQLQALIRQEYVELEEGQDKWRSDQLRIARESLYRLRESLSEWEEAYVLKAPVNGQVFVAQQVEAGSPASSNRAVFTILRRGTDSAWRGVMELPGSGVGRVELGSLVEIRLMAYPPETFGVLEGRLASLSVSPDGGIYTAGLQLPDTLETRYGKRIPVHPRLDGTAAIITEKRSLLGRLFDDLRDR